MTEKLSFADAKKRSIAITISSEATGYELSIEIELPSIAEWNEDLLNIEFPVPPTLQRMVKGQKEDYQNFQDPDYLFKRDRTFERLNMRRVVRALRNAGNLEDMSKLSLDELTEECLKEGDKSLYQAIYKALVDIMGSMKGGVEAKKAAFRPDSIPTNGHEGLPEKELVTG